MTLADRIRERLEATGKTARAASLEAGLGPDAIRIILDGRSASPRMKTISALAESLQCDVAYLMGDEAPLTRNLRNLMSAQGLNPFSLAAKAGLDRDYVRNIFRGKARSPGVEGLSKVAAALGVTTEDLLSPGFSGAATTTAAHETAAAPPAAQITISHGKVRLTLDQEVSVSAAQRILAIIEEDPVPPGMLRDQWGNLHTDRWPGEGE